MKFRLHLISTDQTISTPVILYAYLVSHLYVLSYDSIQNLPLLPFDIPANNQTIDMLLHVKQIVLIFNKTYNPSYILSINL